jgi:hypothetical protein
MWHPGLGCPVLAPRELYDGGADDQDDQKDEQDERERPHGTEASKDIQTGTDIWTDSSLRTALTCPEPGLAELAVSNQHVMQRVFVLKPRPEIQLDGDRAGEPVLHHVVQEFA